MAVLNNLKKHSGSNEEPETFVGFCKVIVQELLIFLICFSMSALVFVLFFSAFNGLTAKNLTRRPHSYGNCLWPEEWCRVFNKKGGLGQMQSYRTDQQSLSKASGDQKKIAPCQCHWPPAWCRVLYNCEKVSQDIRRPTQSPEQTEEFMLHEVQLPTARPVHGESTTGVND
ncbi:uncharacterized protein LOC111603409 [Drosophila hydei]|uniref:Uncharacterized protein LOC111603409 n=1 Tax=Drosophila hydei TaxID=7224 RepID=A0A6J1M911_DROHY|nr:uncharacterized protein LOC111603409 [Drosophila hydei]